MSESEGAGESESEVVLLSEVNCLGGAENTLSASRSGCTSTDWAVKLLATTFPSCFEKAFT